jgi:ketosteroid isomerase-like protein
MRYRYLISLIFVITISFASFAETKKAANLGPDKAYLQKLLDGWSSLNPANMKQYYVQGDHLFFDIAPVKYSNWAEYQTGTTELLGGYKSLKMTLNDDAQIHHEGNLTWAVATIKEESVTVNDKHELGTFRWTVLFQKQPDGKWLIVHEHTSVPAQD